MSPHILKELILNDPQILQEIIDTYEVTEEKAKDIRQQMARLVETILEAQS